MAGIRVRSTDRGAGKGTHAETPRRREVEKREGYRERERKRSKVSGRVKCLAVRGAGIVAKGQVTGVAAGVLSGGMGAQPSCGPGEPGFGTDPMELNLSVGSGDDRTLASNKPPCFEVLPAMDGELPAKC